MTDGNELVITRTFDAPVALVWRAWSEPEHFSKGFERTALHDRFPRGRQVPVQHEGPGFRVLEHRGVQGNCAHDEDRENRKHGRWAGQCAGPVHNAGHASWLAY